MRKGSYVEWWTEGMKEGKGRKTRRNERSRRKGKKGKKGTSLWIYVLMSYQISQIRHNQTIVLLKMLAYMQCNTNMQAYQKFDWDPCSIWWEIKGWIFESMIF